MLNIPMNLVSVFLLFFIIVVFLFYKIDFILEIWWEMSYYPPSSSHNLLIAIIIGEVSEKFGVNEWVWGSLIGIHGLYLIDWE